MIYKPEEDGITHINIYSKGNTLLGRKLSNWYHSPYHTPIGSFESIEGLIFFLGSFNEKLRWVHGFEAKKLGEELDRGIRLPEDVFKRFIVAAMETKGEEFKNSIVDSTLPFTHYYRYANNIVEPEKWRWQIEEWERIRKELKNE